jgi:hypothetical protein
MVAAGASARQAGAVGVAETTAAGTIRRRNTDILLGMPGFPRIGRQVGCRKLTRT